MIARQEAAQPGSWRRHGAPGPTPRGPAPPRRVCAPEVARLLHAREFSARGSKWPPQLQNFFMQGFPTEDGCLVPLGPRSCPWSQGPSVGSGQLAAGPGWAGAQAARTLHAAKVFLSNVGIFWFCLLVFSSSIC